MIYLTFLTTDPLPNGALQLLGQQWNKQLSPFVKLNYQYTSSTDGVARAMRKQKLNGDIIIVLDAEGTSFSSETFAAYLENQQESGRHITVILGGAKGLSNEIKVCADLTLSLSPMTTTHDLAHLFFLEQLYRAMTIISGKTYHY